MKKIITGYLMYITYLHSSTAVEIMREGLSYHNEAVLHWIDKYTSHKNEKRFQSNLEAQKFGYRRLRHRSSHFRLSPVL